MARFPTAEAEIAAGLSEGPGWILLEWIKPSSGRLVAACKAQRRLREVEVQEDARVSVEPQTLLSSQRSAVAHHLFAQQH